MPAMSCSENKKNTLNILFEHLKEFSEDARKPSQPFDDTSTAKKDGEGGKIDKKIRFCLAGKRVSA